MKQVPIVYIDRRYDNGWDVPQPWQRQRRELHDEATWRAVCDADEAEEAGFEAVADAIAWGRQREDIVLVRLGSTVEAMYSAGSRHATERVDGTGWPFPPWPPSSWPNYTGPPEPGWPAYGGDSRQHF